MSLSLHGRDARPLMMLLALALGAMTVPQLTIMGDRDFQSAEGTREWVSRPGAALLLVSCAGHAVWRDRPGAFVEAVDTFLEGRLPKGAEERSSR
jgi:pimeloyl-ACP methyl ester carboxylesterase